jgi:hypothetical protein
MVPLSHIEAVMGHSACEMKKRYARVKAEALRETIEKMEISDAGGSQMMQK